MQLVIVSGLSGSGKTVALKALEDIGYYCIDNIPPRLIPNLVADSQTRTDSQYKHLAIGVDARSSTSQIAGLCAWFPELAGTALEVEILFLQSYNDVLLRRYGETRHKHPLSKGELNLSEAVEAERRLMQPLMQIADWQLDTSDLSVHELSVVVRQRYALDEETTANREPTITFTSFGFKHGNVSTADFVFDLRCLPNPYWEESLRNYNGHDQAVTEWLSEQGLVNDMYSDISGMLDRWIPEFAANNRAYITVAVGCTGGKHRSVYMANRLTEYFSGKWKNVLLRHRDTPAPTQRKP
ncbi:MAG: UPF0042 nucleotide-binding protein [Pseudoalteromonas tetraodonis]|jgi:UPF0042 nucleotide-binding protein